MAVRSSPTSRQLGQLRSSNEQSNNNKSVHALHCNLLMSCALPHHESENGNDELTDIQSYDAGMQIESMSASHSSNVLSVAQLRAIAVIQLASHAPTGPCSRLFKTKEFTCYCTQWAEEVVQQSRSRECKAPCWTIRLETSCCRFWRWQRGKLYDRLCTFALYEICVEAVPETLNADRVHIKKYAPDRCRLIIELDGETFEADSIDCNTNQSQIIGLYMEPA